MILILVRNHFLMTPEQLGFKSLSGLYELQGAYWTIYVNIYCLGWD